MKNRTYILLLLLLSFLASCEKDEFPDDTASASSRRTILVYLGTDNNFRAEAAEKIEQLKTNWQAGCDGNLLVYSDTGDKPVLVHIYHTDRRGNVADTIETYSSENSASPKTLTRVLNRVKQYRPAQSYGLVVLSHATGWLPAKMSNPPRLKSIILDKGTSDSENYMELSDFAKAIPYKLDFIIFDACFMGSIEVCYELKDKADYIVASPAEVVSPGFVYSSMMRHLFCRDVARNVSTLAMATTADVVSSSTDVARNVSTLAALTNVAKEFYEYYDSQSGMRRSATVSVIRTSELEALKTVFYSAITGRDAACHVSTLAACRVSTIQTFGYGSQKIYFDLGDYIQKLAPERYDDFQATLNKCVVYKANTNSYYSAGTGALQKINTFSGLSVYIPQSAYPAANEAYEKLQWAIPAQAGS